VTIAPDAIAAAPQVDVDPELRAFVEARRDHLAIGPRARTAYVPDEPLPR
jgi:hypothetical protein